MKNKIRFNEFGIRMLPDKLREILFGNKFADKTTTENVRKQKSAAIRQLQSFGLLNTKLVKRDLLNLEDDFPKFSFPDLKAPNVGKHFEIIAEEQIKPYVKVLDEVVRKERTPSTFPSQWIWTSGWTRYDLENPNVGTPVPCPTEDFVAFDVEVCVKDGPQPVIAVALSDKAWYSWCSSKLINPGNETESANIIEPENLISFGDRPPLLIAGHNVGYDRARIREEYSVSGTRTRFIDTMSFHIIVSGMTSEQRTLKAKTDREIDPIWINETSLNNLADVWKLYCPEEKPLKKAKRDVFVVGSLDDVRNDFQSLMQYCAEDARACYKLTIQLYPMFRHRCPHPVTLSGMLEFGTAFLPTNMSWYQYIAQSDHVYDEMNDEVRQTLEQHAKETCQLLHDENFKTDPWMWNQDWSTPELRIKKSAKPPTIPDTTDLDLKFKELIATRKNLYKSQPRAAGYPVWFQELLPRYGDENWTPVIEDLSPAKSVAPSLLRLTWNGHPLHRHKEEKWGFLHKGSNNGCEISAKLIPKSESHPDEVTIPISLGVLFTRLPHKDGKSRVGNPLSKDFMDKVTDGTLSTCSYSNLLAKRVLLSSKIASYWKSNRDRITSQMICRSAGADLAILPQLVIAGTLTRRAVERTWLTASNAKSDRIGSELKTLVRAPEGYHIVGADVDSQELWIAALLGDASYLGDHGCTPFGWMTLQGSKSEGTDMHSKTASVVGVSRDHAKILNYGRIYGAGKIFAKKLLLNFNPGLSDFEAGKLASEMYDQTKGKRRYLLNRFGSICYSACTNTPSKNYVDVQVDLKTAKRLARMKKLIDENAILKDDDNVWLLNETGEHNFLIMCPHLIHRRIDEDKVSYEDGIEFLHTLEKSRPRLPRWSTKENELDLETVVKGNGVWIDGSESFTFNRLEEIAMSDEARTPVLKNKISRVLESNRVGSDYLRSRINWVVQSSGVDYMHLLIVAMKWLAEIYNINARFLISIHDEVRYLVKSEDRYKAAFALQLANLLVRSEFCYELGMNDLPLSVAFFSGVDVDKVMRKDPYDESITPSNPQGLLHGYGIRPGESLTFEEILEKLSTSQ